MSIKILKEDVKVLKHFTKNSILLSSLKVEDTFLSEEEYEEVKRDFIIAVRLELRSLKRNTSYINYAKLDELIDKYMEKCYEPIREKYHHLDDGIDIKSEDMFIDALVIAREIINIKKIPSMYKDIENLLNEIKSNNLSYSINTYIETFNSYKNDGATYDEYNKLKKELESIIKKTYFKNITSILSSELSGNLLVSDNDKIKILNKDNVEFFNYGFIYSPKDILTVTTKKSNIFIPFSGAIIDSLVIKLSDDAKPIGVYSVSMGEKELSSNYENSKKLQSKLSEGYNLEIDLTKVLPSSKIDKYKRELIDRLIYDKGVEITNKDDEFYKRFDIFFNRFIDLKKSSYDKGNVINLFDFYYNVIFSQKYINLDYTLDKCSCDEIKDVLENNIYFEYNIFRNKELTNNDISIFTSKFKLYKNNNILNNVYPGLNLIMDYLLKIEDDKFDEVRDYLNSLTIKDCWLISQYLNPIHQ